jgi:hypothetical protein
MQDSFYILYSPAQAAESNGAGFWSAEDGWSGFDSAAQFDAGLRSALPFPKSVRRDVGWVLVGSILYLSLAKEFSTIAETASRFDTLADCYGDDVIGDRVEMFDALEIQGVRDSHQPRSEWGNSTEIDNEHPQAFSVYARYKRTDDQGGVDCIGDFASHADAAAYADELSASHGWPVHDYVPPCAQNPMWISSVELHVMGDLSPWRTKIITGAYARRG